MRLFPPLPVLLACSTVLIGGCEKNYFTTNIADTDTVYIGYDTTRVPVVHSITTYAVGVTQPTGIEFDAAGGLLVAEFVNPGTVMRVSPTGVVGSFAGGAGIPPLEWLAIDSAGYVYVSCQDNTVKRVAAGGGTLTTFVDDQANPTGVTFDRAGNLYVGNINENSVRVYSPAGALIRSITERVGGPVGLAFDPAGNLFIANRFDSVITKVDTAGVVTDFARIPAVNALVADRFGNLFAAEADDYRGHIYFISRKGAVYLIAATYTNPGGLALDPAGNLIVASWSGGYIQKLTL